MWAKHLSTSTVDHQLAGDRQLCTRGVVTGGQAGVRDAALSVAADDRQVMKASGGGWKLQVSGLAGMLPLVVTRSAHTIPSAVSLIQASTK